MYELLLAGFLLGLLVDPEDVGGVTPQIVSRLSQDFTALLLNHRCENLRPRNSVNSSTSAWISRLPTSFLLWKSVRPFFTRMRTKYSVNKHYRRKDLL
jgi:hypothetical protein